MKITTVDVLAVGGGEDEDAGICSNAQLERR